MLLVLRVLLVLGLATLLLATRKDRTICVKLGNGTKLKGKTVKLVLDPSVQPQIASRSASPIANLSLSPWTYRDTCVASRIPMKIAHAQCLTSGCLSLQGGGGEDLALEAKPIYYQVLVLHRVRRQTRSNNGRKKTKKYDFTLGTEVISVGCTCVRPSVIPQQ